MTSEEPSVVGFLPHRQPWAGRPPRVECLAVGAGIPTHPFKEIQNQGLNVVERGIL